MSNNDIFAPLDDADLQRQGVLSAPDEAGWRRIYRWYSAWSSGGVDTDIPLDITSDYDGDFTRIPDKLMSRATIEYIGFVPERAAELWDQWTCNETDRPILEGDSECVAYDKFIDFITEDFASRDFLNFNDLDWFAFLALAHYGLDDGIQSLIMDPNVKRYRLSATCASGCASFIRAKHTPLVSLQSGSLKREKALRRAGEEAPR